MSTVFDSVNITGMRKTHFEQLYEYLIERERDEWYYGRKDLFEKRHKELKEWLSDIINYIENGHVVIPKKPT